MEMGLESNMKCSVSILIGLKHEGTLPPSTMPTIDAAVDVDHGMWTLNEFTGNNNMLLEENSNFYRWQRKKSHMNSDSDSKHILKQNIAEENLPATPKDHIVPLDQKSKTLVLRTRIQASPGLGGLGSNIYGSRILVFSFPL